MFLAGGTGVLPGLAFGVWKVVVVCGRVLFSFVVSFHFFSFGLLAFSFPFLFILTTYLPGSGSQLAHAGSPWRGSSVAARGLPSCGAWACCSIAGGILVPQTGIKPALAALEGKVLATGPRGKSQEKFFLK